MFWNLSLNCQPTVRCLHFLFIPSAVYSLGLHACLVSPFHENSWFVSILRTSSYILRDLELATSTYVFNFGFCHPVQHMNLLLFTCFVRCCSYLRIQSECFIRLLSLAFRFNGSPPAYISVVFYIMDLVYIGSFY